MIMWPKAKRSVADTTAAAIASAARAAGAQPVGVFVDEDAGAIEARCRAADVGIAQLHGDGARAALAHLTTDLKVGLGRAVRGIRRPLEAYWLGWWRSRGRAPLAV
jgi:phosphoribosylanthranilate isomerase